MDAQDRLIPIQKWDSDDTNLQRVAALVRAVHNLHVAVPLQYSFTMHCSLGADYGIPHNMIYDQLSRLATVENRKMVMYDKWGK